MKMFLLISSILFSIFASAQTLVDISEADNIRKDASEAREDILRQAQIERQKMAMIRDNLKVRQEQAEQMRLRLKASRLKSE